MKTATEYEVPEDYERPRQIVITCPECLNTTWASQLEYELKVCRCSNCHEHFEILPLDEVLNRNIVNPIQPIHDPVDHPKHYTGHPSGVECITVTEHMNFCRGNAMKYLWRAGDKGNEIEDLKKARWYIDREIQRLEGGAK